jgi:diguanylate cyclase (GGDEF)-like protein/PAS domain S-box-containing protein
VTTSGGARRSAFEDAFTHAPIGMALVDIMGDVIRANPALSRITGHTAEASVARLFGSRSYPDDAHADALQGLELLHEPGEVAHVEKQYRHAQGHEIWVALHVSLVRGDDDEPRRLIVQVQDISDRKRRESRLEHLVDHDHLTGLLNSRSFGRALEHESKSSARYGDTGAVLLLDLDHFKSVNDQYGHKTGDDVLKSIAETLLGRVRETDIVARLGGDEFGIILPRVDGEHATVVADGIVQVLRDRHAPSAKHRIAVTASVGIAMFDGQSSAEILAAADLAMYEAKASGRDRFAGRRHA